jgi:hypothetical protein
VGKGEKGEREKVESRKEKGDVEWMEGSCRPYPCRFSIGADRQRACSFHPEALPRRPKRLSAHRPPPSTHCSPFPTQSPHTTVGLTLWSFTFVLLYPISLTVTPPPEPTIALAPSPFSYRLPDLCHLQLFGLISRLKPTPADCWAFKSSRART